MDIIPIQASAVPCERVFSSAKETTTACRNQIKPELMEAFQMLKYSFTRGRALNFTEGMSKEEEQKELEEWLEGRAQVPEDIKGYVLSLITKEDME